ncbi:MAG: hypothetical protein V3T88_06250 [Nitrosomonadaceae bacterium]
MSTLTTNHSFILPAVNDPVDADLWGGATTGLNANWISLDAILATPAASKFGAIVVQSTDDAGFEILSGQGTTGQILTSNGADALPSFQANATDVITTRGDLIRGDSSGDPERLAIGTAAQILTSDGTDAAWATPVVLAGTQLQVITATTTTRVQATTVMPIDNTITQNTEGDEIETVAITPGNTNNLLIIDVDGYIGNISSVVQVGGAIFQDATAGALAAKVLSAGTINDVQGSFTIRHIMTAGTTSATTFKFRGGPSSAATVNFNGDASGDLFGGVSSLTMTVTEIKV